VSQYFDPQTLVLDITLCGTWFVNCFFYVLFDSITLEQGRFFKRVFPLCQSRNDETLRKSGDIPIHLPFYATTFAVQWPRYWPWKPKIRYRLFWGQLCSRVRDEFYRFFGFEFHAGFSWIKWSAFSCFHTATRGLSHRSHPIAIVRGLERRPVITDCQLVGINSIEPHHIFLVRRLKGDFLHMFENTMATCWLFPNWHVK